MLRSRSSVGQLRVLLVEPNLVDNGAMRVTLDRARRWQQSGSRVDLFVVAHTEDEMAVPAGVRLQHATRVPRRLRQTLLPGFWRLHRAARRCDVVVSGREIGHGLISAAVVARSARRPLATTVQSRPDLAIDAYVEPRLRRLTRRILSQVDLAVCVAAGLEDSMSRLGLPAARSRTVTNGVDVAGIRQAARLDPEIELPTSQTVVASGRMEAQKGFDLLLRAHAIALRDNAPHHVLVLLGDGTDRPELERLSVELGVRDSVVFAGFVANPHAIVARAALFVLPSRWEGFPLALVEALCVGAPVVAADCESGPREVLDGERFGRLVAVEDEHAMAAAMSEHLRKPDDLRARASAGAAEASTRFDPVLAARTHLDLLTALARAPRR